VTGIELDASHGQNLLVKLKSVNTLVWQFIICSAQNVACGNVMVSRGTFGLYRGDLIRDTLDAYLGDTFLGHRVIFADDSMLTTFALGRVGVRYLSLRSWGWWFTVLPTWWFFAFLALLGAVIVDGRHAHGFGILMLYVGAAWGWLVSVRMFALRRSVERWLDRLEAFFLVPFAMAWIRVVLRPIRLYGIATCLDQGWKTRGSKIEIITG